MLVAAGRGGVSTMGRSWAFLVGSEVPAFRTIARGEIEDTPGCVIALRCTVSNPWFDCVFPRFGAVLDFADLPV